MLPPRLFTKTFQSVTGGAGQDRRYFRYVTDSFFPSDFISAKINSSGLSEELLIVLLNCCFHWFRSRSAKTASQTEFNFTSRQKVCLTYITRPKKLTLQSAGLQSILERNDILQCLQIQTYPENDNHSILSGTIYCKPHYGI